MVSLPSFFILVIIIEYTPQKLVSMYQEGLM